MTVGPQNVVIVLVTFAGVCAASISHTPPAKRVRREIAAKFPSPWFEHTFLKQGEILLVDFASPHGVLAVASHTDFLAYVGLADQEWTAPEWCSIPANAFGFLSFGELVATVELVAVRDTTLMVSALFADESGRACTEIIAASSSNFALRHFRGITSRSCFVATDWGVRASVSGRIGSGSLIVDGDVSGGMIGQPFHMISFSNNGSEVSDVDFQFWGGGTAFNYDRVTSQSAVGIVGKAGGFSDFTPLSEQPWYPGRETMGITWSLVLIGVATATMLFACWVMVGRLIRKNRSEAEEEAHGQLFDPQDKSIPQWISQEGGTTPDGEREQTNEELPDSPYEAEYMHL
jgi:hypothetical protein